MQDVNCKIKKIVSSHVTQTDEISESSILEELKISSLEFIKLMVEIEDTFGVEIPDESLNVSEFKDVQSIITLVDGLLKQNRE